MAVDDCHFAYGLDICNKIDREKLKNLYTMKLRPLADRVLIAPEAAEEVTASGIIIPDASKEKPLRGRVLAVGTGTKDEEMVLKVDDVVPTVNTPAPKSTSATAKKGLIMRGTKCSQW